MVAPAYVKDNFTVFAMEMNRINTGELPIWAGRSTDLPSAGKPATLCHLLSSASFASLIGCH
jgi:hypothetical protein